MTYKNGVITVPLSIVETWPVPNYVDPKTSGWVTVAMIILLSVAAVAVFCLRMYARIVKLKNVGRDDWVMLAALCLTIVNSVTAIFVLKADFCDRHVWDVPFKYFPQMRKWQIANEFLYLVASGLIKISILLFLLRFTNTVVTKVYKYITWGSLAFVALHVTAFSILLFLNCIPINSYWMQTDPVWLAENSTNFHCIDEGSASIATGVFGVAQDFIAATLPVVLFWDLQMSRRKKMVLMSLFAIGYLICVIGGIRIFYMWESYDGSFDLSWNGGFLVFWSTVELLLAIICASAPALKCFFDKPQNTLPNHVSGVSPTDFPNASVDSYSSFSTSDTTWKPDTTIVDSKIAFNPLALTPAPPRTGRQHSIFSFLASDKSHGSSVYDTNPFPMGDDVTAKPHLRRIQTLGDVHVEKSIEVVRSESAPDDEPQLRGFERADRQFG